MSIKAVIFDWAGTTIDHGSLAPVQAFVEVFRRGGVAITEAEARGPMGSAKRDHIAAILGLPRVTAAWQREHGRAPTDADISTLYAAFVPVQAAILPQHSLLIEGIADVVAALRARKIQIGSTTGYSRELMSAIIPGAAQVGFAPDAIVCADDVTSGRPAPWMNFQCAERLGVYPMRDIVIVDDTLVGILAARNAGALAVAVSKTGNALGLSADQARQLPNGELDARLADIERDFYICGAHLVIRSAAHLVEKLKRIEAIQP